MRNNSPGSLSGPRFSDHEQILIDLQEERDKKIRAEADEHLLLIGKRLNHIFSTPGFSDAYNSSVHETSSKFVKINDWSFYDERYISGTSLYKHIPDALKAHPELVTICSWLTPFMTPYLNNPFDVAQVETFHEQPYSKFPQARYNVEAAETFVYTIKCRDLPNTPLQLTLNAHPFTLFNYVMLKLYFITHDEILIDFFFWPVNSEVRSVLLSPSSSSSFV